MSLTATFIPQTVEVVVSTANAEIALGTPVVKEYVNADPYKGDYEITPTSEAQTLPVHNKRMTANLVINPIPSNYGRIDWNGQYLTVS